MDRLLPRRRGSGDPSGGGARAPRAQGDPWIPAPPRAPAAPAGSVGDARVFHLLGGGQYFKNHPMRGGHRDPLWRPAARHLAARVSLAPGARPRARGGASLARTRIPRSVPPRNGAPAGEGADALGVAAVRADRGGSGAAHRSPRRRDGNPGLRAPLRPRSPRRVSRRPLDPPRDDGALEPAEGARPRARGVGAAPRARSRIFTTTPLSPATNGRTAPAALTCFNHVHGSAVRGEAAVARVSGAVGLFAKAPRPGRVKTRLVPPLTHEEAAAFARLCLE